MIDLGDLSRYPAVSIDVETTGLHWYRDRVFGVAICAWDGMEFHSDYFDVRDKPIILDALKKQAPRIQRYVNHNAKFDAHMLMNEGIYVPLEKTECTSVRAALINEHERDFGLDALAKEYVGEGKHTRIYQELASLFGGAATPTVQMKNLHRAPVDLVRKYAIIDAEIALRLWLWQEEEIKHQGLQQVWELEKALMPVLVDLERRGVRVDIKKTKQALVDIDVLAKRQQTVLDSLGWKDVNANSAPQMRKLFGAEKRDGRWYTKYGQLLETTDGGQGSIGKSALRSMAEAGIREAQAVLDVRKALKAKQFLEKHILEHEIDGYVHPNYNQTRGDNELGTGTGRFSINDPALQQIPSRDKEVAQIVRACFVPKGGEDWICADWDQFEFRWFAHYVNDPAINKIYRDNPEADFHKLVADITGLPRSPRFAGDANAKQINLGQVFGMGPGKLASEMGLPFEVETRNGRDFLIPGEEAKAVFAKYHGAIPGVRGLLDNASSIAKSRGYVMTVAGRHLRFPGGQFTHKAGGLIFQGTSADCMKQKMLELHAMSKAEGFDMLLSVHDELDFSVPKKKKKVVAEIKRVLETFDGKECPIRCRIPIRSSVVAAENWYEASK